MKMKPLTAFCALNMGQSPSSETYNEKNVGLPFFQGNADFGEVHPKVRIWCSSPVKVAASGDILISVRAPIGAMNIANAPCCIGRGLAALSPNPDTCVQEYLYYALQSRIDSLIAQGTGSTFKAIGKKTLEDTQIPAYSLDEQQIISDTLSETDQLISKAKAQVSLLDQLVKSRFVEMFGENVPTVRLGSVCQMINGDRGKNYPSGEDFVPMGIPFVNAGHLQEGRVDFSSMNYITEEKYALLSQGKMRRNDILYCLRGSLGKHGLVDFERGAVASSLVILRCNEQRILPQFLFYAIETPEIEKQLKAANNGSSQPNLSAASVKAYNIKLPSINKQTEFAAFVAEVDKSKFSLKNGRKEACFAVKYIWESLCRGILI